MKNLARNRTPRSGKPGKSCSCTPVETTPAVLESELKHPKLKVILLAVSGMSPAILTETVWALAHQSPPVVPDEVVVITTTRGRDDLQRDLLTPRPDWSGRTVWEVFRQNLLSAVVGEPFDAAADLRLQLSAPRLIELPDSARGLKQPAADLRSAADNAAAADFILEEVRRLVENPDTRVIASIAGGRKTMGALLYACMSLLGRASDRVTHVLVNEPFETCRGFFYPGQPGGVLPHAAGPLDPLSARIELAEIPFVPLRNLFERELARKPGTFATLAERCRQRVTEIMRGEVRLEVRADRPEIMVNQTVVSLSVQEYVLVRHLAEAARAGQPAIDGYAAAAEPVVKTARRIYADHHQNNFSDWRYKALPPGKGFDEINERWLTKHLSSIRDKLRAAGGDAWRLSPLLPAKGRFSLDLPKTAIVIGGA